MSDVPKSTAPIKVQETRYKTAVSESLAQRLGGAINYLLDAIPVGTVFPSFLDETQFQTLAGEGWVLCDGRGVGGSTYETITGNGTIPDARGQFLRGINNGASIDPAGERAPGALQTQDFQTIGSLGFGGVQGIVYDPGNGDIVQDEGSEFRRVAISNIPFGGSETRPKNIAVNYFIRIN